MNILEVNSDEYRRWRDRKLSSFTSDIDKLMVEIKNPRKLSTAEISLSSHIINQSNLVFFQLDQNENEIMELLGVLATLRKAPIAGQMLHPNGPLATARSGMIISDIVNPVQRSIFV